MTLPCRGHRQTQEVPADTFLILFSAPEQRLAMHPMSFDLVLFESRKQCNSMAGLLAGAYSMAGT